MFLLSEPALFFTTSSLLPPSLLPGSQRKQAAAAAQPASSATPSHQEDHHQEAAARRLAASGRHQIVYFSLFIYIYSSHFQLKQTTIIEVNLIFPRADYVSLLFITRR